MGTREHRVCLLAVSLRPREGRLMAPSVKAKQAPAVAPSNAVAVPREHMFVAINFPDCIVGMGARYAVATRGRKYVHIFYIPTLTSFSVSHAAFALMRPRQADEIKPAKLRHMLKAKRALYEGLGLQYSAEAADRANKATLRALVS